MSRIDFTKVDANKLVAMRDIFKRHGRQTLISCHSDGADKYEFSQDAIDYAVAEIMEKISYGVGDR